jgi:hypothetical protein
VEREEMQKIIARHKTLERSFGKDGAKPHFLDRTGEIIAVNEPRVLKRDGHITKEVLNHLAPVPDHSLIYLVGSFEESRYTSDTFLQFRRQPIPLQYNTLASKPGLFERRPRLGSQKLALPAVAVSETFYHPIAWLRWRHAVGDYE